MKNVQASGPMGSLERLPHDVIISILGRINNFKLLRPCLLVSKTFASLIYRVNTLTVSLPPYKVNYSERLVINELLREVICSKREEFPKIMACTSMKSLKFFKSIRKFKNLKSIHVEIKYPDSDSPWSLCYSPSKLRLICTRHASKVESVVAVLPASIRKKNEYFELPVNKLNPIEFMGEDMKIYGDRIKPSYFTEWLILLFLLIKGINSLESLTIADSSKSRDDVFTLRDEQLAEWRELLIFKQFPGKVIPKYYRVIIEEPELHLPISEYVIKGALCMVMSLPGEFEGVAKEFHHTMIRKYNGEKELFGEAVIELKKLINSDIDNNGCKFNIQQETDQWTIVGRHRQTSDGWTMAGKIW